MSSFYSEEELKEIGFQSVGENVSISKKTSIYRADHIVIGSNVRIDDFCFLSGKITVEDYVHVAPYCSLVAGEYGIELKAFSGLSSRCMVYAMSDDYSGEYLTNPTIDAAYTNVTGEKIVVGKYVVVGTGSTLLPGASIGEGTAVGSMSLVRDPLRAWGIYVGIPCRRIKERRKDLLEYARRLEQKKDC